MTPSAYNVQGVFSMCRKSQLRGCLILGLGIGIAVGYLLDSWLLCCMGGIFLIVSGFCMMNHK